MTVTQPENLRVALPLEQIAAICEKYGVAELSVFGSALREDFRSDSDVDFIVQFLNDDAGAWSGKFADLENALSTLLGRKVDVASRRAIEQSENYLRRKHILKSARIIYVA